MTVTEKHQAVRLQVGIWSGAEARSGLLLYRRLLAQAMRIGLPGATVVTQVEGGQRTRGFRSVESEIESNELPLWLEFVDDTGRWPEFVEDAKRAIGRHGIVVASDVEQFDPELRKEGKRVNRPTYAFADRSRAGLQVQVYTLEGNKVDGKPVYQAAAEFLRARNIFWISTARGLCGFGDGRRIHKARWFSRNSDIPIVMTVVDFREQLEPHVEDLAALVGDQGVVSVTDVTWLHPHG